MSLKEKHAFSEKQLVNQRFLVCYGSVIGILLLAYIGEYIKGNRTPGYGGILYHYDDPVSCMHDPVFCEE